VRGLALSTSTAATFADLVAATGARVQGGALPQGFLQGVSIDSRTLGPGQVFFAVHGPRFDGHEFLADAAARGAVAAVVHRDVPAPAPLPLLRVPNTTKALADFARHVRRAAGVPVVVITGSMGKTTTKEMTAGLLSTRGEVLKTEGNLNNRYGLPLTLLRLEPEHAFAVLELGMSAAGEMSELSRIALPDVAVITNVAPVHLEFFDSVDAIAAAKAEVFDGLREGGLAVLNGDDPRLRRIGEARKGRVAWFGRDRRYDVSAENWRGTAFGMRFDLRLSGRSLDVALPLAGPHFVMDFLAAAAVAHALGVSAEAIANAASSFRPARHRGEVHRLGQGITLTDDSYNSSPEALAAAVVALTLGGKRRRVAVLGDMLELGPTAPELHHAAGLDLGRKVDVVVAVGAYASEFLAGARASGMAEANLLGFADAAQAAAAIVDIVAPGDAILVKGSRGIRLEAVVDVLRARFGDAEG
jgi:UDP-N-acetylmuramoyl-tripeptide--D-alanyl-D-alanine ligase